MSLRHYMSVLSIIWWPSGPQTVWAIFPRWYVDKSSLWPLIFKAYNIADVVYLNNNFFIFFYNKLLVWFLLLIKTIKVVIKQICKKKGIKIAPKCCQFDLTRLFWRAPNPMLNRGTTIWVWGGLLLWNLTFVEKVWLYSKACLQGLSLIAFDSTSLKACLIANVASIWPLPITLSNLLQYMSSPYTCSLNSRAPLPSLLAYKVYLRPKQTSENEIGFRKLQVSASVFSGENQKSYSSRKRLSFSLC